MLAKFTSIKLAKHVQMLLINCSHNKECCLNEISIHFFVNNDDAEDGNDDGNEWKFVLKLTEQNIHFLNSFENHFCLNWLLMTNFLSEMTTNLKCSTRKAPPSQKCPLKTIEI